MSHRELKLLLAIAVNLIAISESLKGEAYPKHDHRPSPTAVPYGTDRKLTNQEFREMQFLVYPQSERAFVRRFGSGSYRDKNHNYHRINSRLFLKVRVQDGKVTSISY